MRAWRLYLSGCRVLGRPGSLQQSAGDHAAPVCARRPSVGTIPYLPIVFNFDKPETKDFTETVRLLAGLSKFVIADLTSPKSAPYELGAIVHQTMIPFQPIIEKDETPFSMLQDLWINYPDRVFRPIHYSSVDALIASLDEKIIRPAEARFVELLKRKADTMGGEHV